MADEDHSSGEEALLTDQNAFGLWVGWFDAEDVEYSASADKFAPRIVVLRAAVSDYCASFPLGDRVSVLDLGTSFYFEVEDGDQTEEPIAWLRALRVFLAQGDWATFGAVTYGGRWSAAPGAEPLAFAGMEKLGSFGPSEPFLRAVAAQALAHDDEDAGTLGWGTGLFVDLDVLEALQRKLRNEPTTMRAGGASFVRIAP